MKLSLQDIALLNQLIKVEERAYRARHLLLALGLLSLLVAIGGFALLLTSSRESAMHWGNHPVFYLLGASGGIGIGWYFRGLKGNPTNKLLISLATKLTESDEHNSA